MVNVPKSNTKYSLILLHCIRDVFNFIGLDMIESDSINIFSPKLLWLGCTRDFNNCNRLSNQAEILYTYIWKEAVSF